MSVRIGIVAAMAAAFPPAAALPCCFTCAFERLGAAINATVSTAMRRILHDNVERRFRIERLL